MATPVLKLTAVLVTILFVTILNKPAHAISPARQRLDACTFDQGSAGINSDCSLKLTQIATCWTHPRVLSNLSNDERERWLAGRNIKIAPIAFSAERPDQTADWLVAQRGSSIANYLISLGVPPEGIKIDITDQSVVDGLPIHSINVYIYACYEYYYRASSFRNYKAPDPTDPKSLFCPLPGEELELPWSGSYTSFGRSLDFEPLVMGAIRASPSGVRLCSDTPLPVYKHYTPIEAEQLRTIVQTPFWKIQVARNNLSYSQAVIQRVLGEDDLLIAKSLLHAVWSAKPESLSFILAEAVEAWSRIAIRQHHDDDWVAANWLAVDLNRQLGNFSVAAQNLDDFEALRLAGQTIITDVMISRERRLIEIGSSRPYAATPQFPDP